MPFVRRRRLLLPDSHSSMPGSHDREDVARSDGDIKGRCVLPGAPGHRAEGVPRHAGQPRGDRPPANGRGCDSFPPDHILGIVRCDPPLRRPDSGAFRVLSRRQGVPAGVRADRDALRRPRVAGQMALTTGPIRNAYGGWETVAFSSREPARIVIMSPMMLAAIRAPSSITQPREMTLSRISEAAPMTLPSRMMLFRTTAFPSIRADS